MIIMLQTFHAILASSVRSKRVFETSSVSFGQPCTTLFVMKATTMLQKSIHVQHIVHENGI